MRRQAAPLHSASSKPTLRREPQGNPYRPPPSHSYSHIQIVPKASPKTSVNDDGPESPPMIFKKPSYSEEAANHITSALQLSADRTRPSLANMTSGTTFAAKARAAELNAVRSRKAVKELDNEDDVPSTTTTSLGALKFTKPRNKGRAWKTLNLDEIPEASLEPNQSGQNQHLGWESSTSQGQAITRLVHVHDNSQTTSQDSSYRVSDYASNPHNLAQILATIKGGQQSNSGQANVFCVGSCQDSNLDPFVEKSSAGLNLGDIGYTFDHNHVNSMFSQPRAPYKALENGYSKAPNNQDHYRAAPCPSLNGVSNYQAAKMDGTSPTVTRPIDPNADSYQRDPMPYTGYTNAAKKDILFQNLHNVVESSKAQGSLPSSTRTVLYDPLGCDGQTPALRDGGQTRAGRASSECDKEVLKISDPLPWKNRPVNIFNAIPPATARFGLADQSVLRSTADSPPRKDRYNTNKYIWSLVPQPESPSRRLLRVEAWWRYDGRGQHRLRNYLEMVADDHQMTKRSKNLSKDYQSMQKTSGRYARPYDEWSDTSESTEVPDRPSAGDVINRLLIPVLSNLQSYVEETEPSCFKPFSKPHTWCVDTSADGNKSFFGGDWGQPPNRVGRDPRYRPTFHDGRYTVFEPTDGRVAGREF
ncbi:MAG: hypothetical protein LQ351_006902 [Letrouitia transgressa]|nr:MAG: hypothetical protein LQ351_006902 [Letrouitia transgressa]